MLGKGIIPTDTLPPDGKDVNCCDQLHVPTPWHNCVVEMSGHANLYITKSGIARRALSSVDLSGGIVESPDQGQYVYMERSCNSL